MAPVLIVVSALPGFLSHDPRLAAASVTDFCNRELVTVAVVPLLPSSMPLLLRAGALLIVDVVERLQRSSTYRFMLAVAAEVAATDSGSGRRSPLGRERGGPTEETAEEYVMLVISCCLKLLFFVFCCCL
jgi:hypothetical protein